MQTKFGMEYSYSLCSRAKIFRRDNHKVQNLTAMQSIIRYNDYLNDPYSQGDPTMQIAARADLYTDSQDRAAFGGADSKVTP